MQYHLRREPGFVKLEYFCNILEKKIKKKKNKNIPCQLHPGQKDSTQHFLDNVLGLWI